MKPLFFRKNELNARIVGHLRDLLKETGHLDSDGARAERAVHKTRVLLRRVEALFSLCTGLERDRKLQKALKRQKKLRKRLGSVRDWDVLKAQWKEWAEGRACFGAVDKEIRAKREKSFERFRREFDADTIRKSVRRMQKAAVRGEMTRGPLTALVQRILKDRELHEVRLDVKKLRYTLEGLETIAGQSAETIVFLKELQTELGHMNDLECLAAFLKKLKKKRVGRWDRATLAAVSKAADDMENRLKTDRRRWNKMWPARRKELRELRT